MTGSDMKVRNIWNRKLERGSESFITKKMVLCKPWITVMDVNRLTEVIVSQYTNIESLHCTPDINLMFCQLKRESRQGWGRGCRTQTADFFRTCTRVRMDRHRYVGSGHCSQLHPESFSLQSICQAQPLSKLLGPDALPGAGGPKSKPCL